MYTPEPGNVLDGKYRLAKELGQGGMGMVFEAVHERIRKRVAVKFLRGELAKDEKSVARFQREAQAAAAIGHRGIIDIYDIGHAEDAPYLVMERLEGQSLAQLLDTVGCLDEAMAAYLGCQTLSALAAAHDAGILHRDLKPDNIFLVDAGRELPDLKLLDFGISKVLDHAGNETSGITVTGTVLGTPYYMSPEQARGMKDLDRRVDIYSMGIILYECLTGTVPFTGDNYNEVLAKILTEDVVPPASVRDGLSPRFENTILKALEKDRDQRYASAHALMADLLPLVAQSNTSHIPMPAELRDSSRMLAKDTMIESPTVGIAAPTGSDEPGRAQPQAPATRGNGEARSITGPDDPPPDAELAEGDIPTALVGRNNMAAPGRSRKMAILGVLAAFVALGTASLFLGGTATDDRPGVGPNGPPSGAPATPARAASGPASGSPASGPERSSGPTTAQSIELRVVVVPAEAQTFVDNAPLDANPFMGRFQRDGLHHLVKATAAGYRTATKAVVFDHDQELLIELLPEAGGQLVSPTPGRPPIGRQHGAIKARAPQKGRTATTSDRTKATKVAKQAAKADDPWRDEASPAPEPEAKADGSGDPWRD